MSLGGVDGREVYWAWFWFCFSIIWVDRFHVSFFEGFFVLTYRIYLIDIVINTEMWYVNILCFT